MAIGHLFNTQDVSLIDAISNSFDNLILIFTLFIGGYMVSDLPKNFLSIFTTIYGQFIALFAINWVLNRNSKYFSIKMVIAESLAFTIILQIFREIVFAYYK